MQVVRKKGKARLPKLKEVIGADFGSQSVRLVGLARDKGGIALTLVGTVYYPRHEGDEPEAFDSFAVADEISDYLKNAGVKSKAVFLSAPSRHAVIRIMPFPDMPYEDLKSSIEFEVEQFSTDDSGGKIIDFSVLREYQEEGKPRLETLIVAIPRTTVLPYLETLMHAKLEVQSLNLSPFATIKAIEYKNDLLYDAGNIIMHMGMLSSDVIIIEDGFLKFNRNIKIGGRHILDAFVDAMRLEEGEILDPSDIEIYEVPRDRELYLNQIINEITEDIERTVHFCKSQEQRSDIHINKIILSGFGIWPKNLDSMLSNRLRLPVMLANPFGYEISHLTNVDPNEVCAMPSNYVAAFGLALEGLGE